MRPINLLYIYILHIIYKYIPLLKEQPRTITRRPPTQQSTADPFQTNFNDNNRRRTTRAPATRRPAPTTRAPARPARPTKSKFPNRLNPQDNQLSDNRNKNKVNNNYKSDIRNKNNASIKNHEDK